MKAFFITNYKTDEWSWICYWMSLVWKVGYKVGGHLDFDSILLAIGQEGRRERLLLLELLLFSRGPNSVINIIAYEVDQCHGLGFKVIIEKVVAFGVHDYHRWNDNLQLENGRQCQWVNASKCTIGRTELSRIIWVLVIIIRINGIKKVPKKVLQIGAFIIANNYRG